MAGGHPGGQGQRCLLPPPGSSIPRRGLPASMRPSGRLPPHPACTSHPDKALPTAWLGCFRSERTGLGGPRPCFSRSRQPGAPSRRGSGRGCGVCSTEAGEAQCAALMAVGPVPSFALRPQATPRPRPHRCVWASRRCQPSEAGRTSVPGARGRALTDSGSSLRASVRGSQHGYGGRRGGHEPLQVTHSSSATRASCGAGAKPWLSLTG